MKNLTFLIRSASAATKIFGFAVFVIATLLSQTTLSQNVGIGTANPAMKLHIARADSDVLLLENTQVLDSNVATAQYYKVANGYTGAIMTIGQNSNEARMGIFTFASGSPDGLIERISILDNGNVGIHTTAPTTNLEIAGDVKVSGKIMNVTDPTDPQDVATKAYVDSLRALIDSLEVQIATLRDTTPLVTDIEGNSYKTVTIGTQVWMAENLKVTRYNDSTPIPLLSFEGSWASTSNAAWCTYNGSGTPYGLLYNFFTVADTNTKNICPVGWHVPSQAEWATLASYLGGSSGAGGKMKVKGYEHWGPPNGGATNESGFNALPGGGRTEAGTFFKLHYASHFWSSTSFSGAEANVQYLDFYYESLTSYYDDKKLGSSVRCIKD